MTGLEYSDEWERTDTMLALAIAFTTKSEAEANPEAEADDGAEQSVSDRLSARDLLGGLSLTDSEAVEHRLTRLESGSREDVMEWMTATIARARASRSGECTRLDEHIHPSQIAEALKREPVRIQSLVLRNLPVELAEPAAQALSVVPANDHCSTTVECTTETVHSPEFDEETAVAAVKRSFLSNFASLDVLPTPTHLDMLSGVELARLVRVLGVRQTAIACRGIAEVETVASFLRRFSAEDWRAIAMHMLAMEEIESGRVEFAERIVQPEIDQGLEGASMLDRIGLSLLAVALRERDPQSRQYIGQKLPVDASRELEAMLADDKLCGDRQIALGVSRDVETIAENLRCKTPIANGNRNGSSEPAADVQVSTGESA